MKHIITTLSLTLLLSCITSSLKAEEQITVDLAKRGAEVRSTMYGIFIEDINRAGDGGLYAEMVQNRSFEDTALPDGYTVNGDRLVSPPTFNHVTGQTVMVENRWTTEAIPGWTILRGGTASVCDSTPYFQSSPHYLELKADGDVVLRNNGYGGYCIREGEVYRLRVIARTDKTWDDRTLTARLVSKEGKLLAKADVKIDLVGEWTDHTVEVKAVSGDDDACLELSATNVKGGTLCLDYVSLMPEHTFCNRLNGMRRDVAEAIAALHPSFVRWPGGCVVEGITLNTRFRWKEALGDPASRPGLYNLWGYRSSCGVGWHEMLQFCEDLGADAMYVCNVGMACQAQTSELLPIERTKEYLDDCLDAIEYAIGDSTTTWGRRRTEAGHPAPYPLRYVELGNENWGAEYDKRYNIFYKAIHERYPQLTLISNYGIDGVHGADEVQMIDPHWYVAPQFFYNNTSLFDTLPCSHNGKPYGIYVGEYACNRAVGSGNLDAALAEASFLTGAERNGDRVWMTSYAPLLESSWYRAWPTNMIWVSPSQVMPRSSYYVQQMMAENRPSYNIYCSKNASEPESQTYSPGCLGFGCWKSKVEYRDAVLTLPDGTSRKIDLGNGKEYVGSWDTDPEGVLRQNAISPLCKYMLSDSLPSTYTLSLRARKTAGKDAFIIFFGMDSDAQEGFYWSVGGQNNSKACVERIRMGENTGQDGDITDFHAEMNRWYSLRIEVQPKYSRLFVNDSLLLEHHPVTSVQHIYSAGYDEASHEIILKAINSSDSDYPVEFNLVNIPMLGKAARTVTLSGPSLLSENTFASPDLIRPANGTCKIEGNTLRYTLPPYSFTVIRVLAQ